MHYWFFWRVDKMIDQRLNPRSPDAVASLVGHKYLLCVPSMLRVSSCHNQLSQPSFLRRKSIVSNQPLIWIVDGFLWRAAFFWCYDSKARARRAVSCARVRNWNGWLAETCMDNWCYSGETVCLLQNGHCSSWAKNCLQYHTNARSREWSASLNCHLLE